jgi:hypothetical protein
MTDHPVYLYRFKTLKVKPRFGSLVDFILLAAECTTGGQHTFREFGHVPNMLLVLCLLQPWTWTFDCYGVSGFIFLACGLYIQTACLCILLLIRFAVIVANIIDKPSAALAKPFDFFAMSNGGKNIDRMIDRLHSRSFRSVDLVLWIFAQLTVSQPWRFTGSQPSRPALARLPSQKQRNRCRCDIPLRSPVHKPRV